MARRRTAHFRDRHGRWRDARGRFVAFRVVQAARARRRMARRARGRFTDAEEHILEDVREGLRGALVQAGAELELTATTQGGTPRADRPQADRRPLHLKLRVIPDRPMSIEVARLLLDRAVRDGEVPPGITIRWIDWAKGAEGMAESGQVPSRRVRRALREFYGAIHHSGSETRFELVR